MTNFKEEILYNLNKYGKTINDIVSVQGDDFKVDKDKFLYLCDFNYSSGYGAAEIPQDLKIVGSDWWIERHEYDGSEWFEFKCMPRIDLPLRNIDKIKTGMWDTWKSIEGEEQDNE